MRFAAKLLNDKQWLYGSFIATANNIDALKFIRDECYKQINEAITTEIQSVNAYRSTVQQDEGEAFIEGMRTIKGCVSGFFSAKIFAAVHTE